MNEKQKPDFLILGAMKAGTSSLLHYLKQHPMIELPSEKELHYYDSKRYSGWRLDDYIAQFPVRSSEYLSGEATPYYLRHPHAPRWVKSDFPQMKLLVILRDPTARAYSHFQQRIANGKETMPLQARIVEEQATQSDAWAEFISDETSRGQDLIELSYLL